MEIFRTTPQEDWIESLSKAATPIFEAKMKQNMELASQMKAQQLMQHLAEVQRRQEAARNAQFLMSRNIPQQEAISMANASKEYTTPDWKQRLAIPGQEAFAEALTYGRGGIPSEQVVQGTDMQTQPVTDTGIRQQEPITSQYSGFRISNIPKEVLRKIPQNMLKQLMDMEFQERSAQAAETKAAASIYKTMSAEQRAIHQESQPYVDEAFKEADMNRKSMPELERMYEASKAGVLDDDMIAKFVEGGESTILGKFINFRSLLNPESQEFNKTREAFINAIISSSPAKKMNKETVKGIRDSVVSLLNSPDARTLILEKMIQLRKIAMEKDEFIRNREKESGYIRGRGFRAQTEDAWKERQQQLLEEFIGNIGNREADYNLDRELAKPDEQMVLPGQQGQEKIPDTLGWWARNDKAWEQYAKIAAEKGNTLTSMLEASDYGDSLTPIPYIGSPDLTGGMTGKEELDIKQQPLKLLVSDQDVDRALKDQRAIAPGEKAPKTNIGLDLSRNALQTGISILSSLPFNGYANRALQYALKQADIDPDTQKRLSTIFQTPEQTENYLNSFLPDVLSKRKPWDNTVETSMKVGTALGALVSAGLSPIGAITLIGIPALSHTLISPFKGKIGEGGQLLLDALTDVGSFYLAKNLIRPKLARESIEGITETIRNDVRNSLQHDIKKDTNDVLMQRKKGLTKIIDDHNKVTGDIEHKTTTATNEVNTLEKQIASAIEKSAEKTQRIDKIGAEVSPLYERLDTQGENLSIDVTDDAIGLVSKLVKKIYPRPKGIYTKEEITDIRSIAEGLKSFIDNGSVTSVELMDQIKRINNVIYQGVPRTLENGRVVRTKMTGPHMNQLIKVKNSLEGMLEKGTSKEFYSDWRKAQDLSREKFKLLDGLDNYLENTTKFITEKNKQKNKIIDTKNKEIVALEKRRQELVDKKDAYVDKTEDLARTYESGEPTLKKRKGAQTTEAYIESEVTKKIPFNKQEDLSQFSTGRTGTIIKNIKTLAERGKSTKNYMEYIKKNYPEIAKQIETESTKRGGLTSFINMIVTR